jgi:hypothetical protein
VGTHIHPPNPILVEEWGHTHRPPTDYRASVSPTLGRRFPSVAPNGCRRASLHLLLRQTRLRLPLSSSPVDPVVRAAVDVTGARTSATRVRWRGPRLPPPRPFSAIHPQDLPPASVDVMPTTGPSPLVARSHTGRSGVEGPCGHERTPHCRLFPLPWTATALSPPSACHHWRPGVRAARRASPLLCMHWDSSDGGRLKMTSGSQWSVSIKRIWGFDVGASTGVNAK